MDNEDINEKNVERIDVTEMSLCFGRNPMEMQNQPAKNNLKLFELPRKAVGSPNIFSNVK